MIKIPKHIFQSRNIFRITSKRFCCLKHDIATKVPLAPYLNEKENTDLIPKKIDLSHETIKLLERLSLVDLTDTEVLNTLKDSIEFADGIFDINTDNVEPMYTVLEDEILELRDDEVTDGGKTEDIIKNSKVIEENYFIAPPGNIPLE